MLIIILILSLLTTPHKNGPYYILHHRVNVDEGIDIYDSVCYSSMVDIKRRRDKVTIKTDSITIVLIWLYKNDRTNGLEWFGVEAGHPETLYHVKENLEYGEKFLFILAPTRFNDKFEKIKDGHHLVISGKKICL